jgi:hypothetical protein
MLNNRYSGRRGRYSTAAGIRLTASDKDDSRRLDVIAMISVRGGCGVGAGCLSSALKPPH